MATNYKWNPGHYVFETPNTGIDEILPQIASIPNLLGVQVRLDWKVLETARDVYTAAPILALLAKCDAQAVPAGMPKKRLRILLTYKSFSKSGFATPAYINSSEEAKVDDGAPLFFPNSDGTFDLTRPVYGSYNYGVGWHPKLYNPWIADRLAKLFQALGPLLDSQPLLEDIYMNETAFGGAQVPINGLNWNNADGLQKFRERATGIANGLWTVLQAAHAAFPTTVVGQYVNFPNTGKFSIIKDPTNPATTPGWPAGTALPPKMALNGVGLGGPDAWLGDTSADNGPFQMYKSYRGVIPLSPSIQNADYSYLNHDDQASDNGTGSITIQNLYYKATQHPTDTSIVTLYGTHVTWSAADYNAPPPHTKTSWQEVKDFFKAKWDSGPDAGKLSPGVDTAVPATLGSPTPVVPPAPVLKLVVDSGVSSTDLITNDGTVGVDRGGVTGGSVEYSTKAAGPWSTAQPALVQGTNTWFARQFNSAGMVSAVSSALTFEFCNTTPALRYITARDLYAIIGFTHPVNLTNAPRPAKTAFTVKVNGVVKTTTTGTFVNEDQKRLRLDWTGALVGSEAVTVSYAVPSDTTKFQDIAGNLVAAFTDVAAINLVGLPELTTSATISTVGGKATGLAMNAPSPLVVGTLSATIAPTMTVEVQRQKDTGAFKILGYATVVGTDWTWQETEVLADALYTYRARVQHGDLNSTAGFSALFPITLDTDPPSPPTIDSLQVKAGAAFTLTGTWSNGAGDALQVAIAGVGTFTTANGLVTSGASWSLALPPMTGGVYAVGASTTDPAGNVALNETPAEILVLPGYGKATLILRFCKRRTV